MLGAGALPGVKSNLSEAFHLSGLQGPGKPSCWGCWVSGEVTRGGNHQHSPHLVGFISRCSSIPRCCPRKPRCPSSLWLWLPPTTRPLPVLFLRSGVPSALCSVSLPPCPALITKCTWPWWSVSSSLGMRLAQRGSWKMCGCTLMSDSRLGETGETGLH